MDFWNNMERLNDYNVMAGLRKFVTENWFFVYDSFSNFFFEG